jgi:small subunit ribosomal protein S17
MSVRDIGLHVSPPPKTCEDPICPFHGSLSLRGKLFRGTTVSIRAKNMATVEREFLKYVSKYMRYEKRRSKLHAHLPPCIDLSVGDKATVAECRKLTKTVSYVVVEKIK